MIMFEQIQVQLSDDDKESMINWYASEHMSDESWEVFMEACHDYQFEDGKHYERAIVDAVVNEMANIILKEHVEREENKFLLFGGCK